MHKFNYRKGLDTGRVCLEMSLKPFIKLDDDYINGVCIKLFGEWKPLLLHASSVAVMLWTADGSEILEYTGDLTEKFNWCNLIGIGNPRKEPQNETEFLNLHVRPVPYSEYKHDFTYRDLKRVIAAIKKVGKEQTGLDICVVETFDPGPEFAKSDFKFNRHKEIASGHIMGTNMWVHCAAKLHAENHRYAAYPNGIKEGTYFGEFLGRQFMALKRDVGFDRIWLSNGFGFSLESWNCCGELFDGKKFDFENADRVRDNINEFWKRFTAETGDTVIETRGSNLSAAMDISAHGSPVDDIYKYNMIAPPNSPWAALNGRFGLELCGYLSRIAELPENGYMFRYYIHDPWWANSPWFDRYGSRPHDLYLPLALARLDKDGKTTKPAGINLLSVDDSFGQMPEKCPNEVIPHILEAYNDYPDKPGLVTWIYPFESYCKTGLRDGNSDRIFMDDWLIESAIDYGMPLDGVISDKNFANADTKHFEDTVLVTCVPEEGSLLEKCVMKAVGAGLRVLLYGNTEFASVEVRTLLGVELGESVGGKFRISQSLVDDRYENGKLSDVLTHVPLVSDGGLREVENGNCDVTVIASVRNGCLKRVYGTFNKSKNLAWVRGSFPHNAEIKGSLPDQISGTESFPPAILLRAALGLFGINIAFDTMSPDDKLPLIIFSHSGGFLYQTSFAKDTTVKTRVSLPEGAPIPCGCDAIVEDSTAEMSSPCWQHDKICVFVRQKERSKVHVRKEILGDSMKYDFRVSVEGLVDADVYFLLPETETFIDYAVNCDWPWFKDRKQMKVTKNGKYAYCEHITGRVDIGWQTGDTRREYTEKGYF